ncbi:MAG: T9SS type A sorting domain-containing protein, partial [Bacteroidota bacterium]
MKTKLLFLLLPIFALQSSAQHDYVPMAVENAHWIYYNSDDDDLPPWIDYYFGYKIQGDIEIEGTWYKKVYYFQLTPAKTNRESSITPTYTASRYLFGAMRDDIPNKKVYGIMFCEGSYSCPCNEEFLMYDFNMNIGDNFEGYCLVVDGDGANLESIMIEHLFDEDRLLYNITVGGLEWAYQLEGIGNYFPYGGLANYGLFRQIGVPFGCPCTDFVRYCIGTNEECLNGFVVVGSDEYHLQYNITIYPNPVKNTLSIDYDSDIKIEIIQLYNVLGKLVLEDNTNFQTINIESLQNGIYL